MVTTKYLKNIHKRKWDGNQNDSLKKQLNAEEENTGGNERQKPTESK